MYDDNYEFLNLVPYLNKKLLIGHNILFDIDLCISMILSKTSFRYNVASKILYNGDFFLLKT
jgi:hypothetical protein